MEILSSGIGGTGVESSALFEDMEDMDNFQSEISFWDEIFTHLRKRENTPAIKN